MNTRSLSILAGGETMRILPLVFGSSLAMAANVVIGQVDLVDKPKAPRVVSEQFKRYLPIAQSKQAFLRAVWGNYDDRERFGHSNKVIFSPDGKHALLGKTRYFELKGKVQSSLELWDVAEHRVLRSLDLRESWLLALALSPDKRRALSAVQVHNKGRETVNTLWDLTTGKPIHTWQNGTVLSLAMSPDGKQALSAGHLGTIDLRDLVAAKQIGRTSKQLGSQSVVHFLPDGKQALSFTHTNNNDGPITLWDLAGGMKEIRSFNHGSPVIDLIVTPDGKRALTMGGGTLKLWETNSGKEIRAITSKELDLTTAAGSVAISPDGKRAVSILYRYGTFATGHEVYSEITHWDLQAGKRLWTGRERQTVSQALFHPDGKHVLIANGAQGFALWDLASGQEARSWGGHLGPVTALAYLPDGKRLLSAGEDEKLKLWDVATGKEVAVFRSHEDAVTMVAVSRDSKRAVSGGADKTVRIWDLAAGTHLNTFKGHTKGVTAVTWTPDGQRILSASVDGTLRRWDAANGKALWVVPAHALGVTALALSPDGRTAVSAGENSLKLWTVGDDKPAEPRSLSGHERPVTCVAFASDGRRLISGSEDRSIKLWDLATGQIKSSFLGHGNWVRAVAFSSDGKRVLSASDDLTVRLWDAAIGKELDRIDLGKSGDIPRALAYAPDGRSFMVGTMGCVLLRFELSESR